MTTALLHPALRGDTYRLKAIDAIVFLALAALILFLPNGLIRWLGLEGASEIGIRAVGVAWAVLGMAALVTVRRPVPQWVCAAFAAAQLGLALFLLVAPFLFGVVVSARGWFATGVLFFFLATSGMAWFFVRDRVADAALRANRQRRPAPPASSSSSL